MLGVYRRWSFSTFALSAVLSSSACADATAPSQDESESTEGSNENDGGDTDASAGEAGSEGEADSGGDGDDGSPPPPDPDPYDPAPTPTPLDASTVETIAAAIDAILDAPPISGYLQSVHVVDVETGQVLYARNASTPQKPASNTKLVSTAVAMEALGRDHRPEMVVYSEATGPDEAGVLAGDLHLIGYHDYSTDDAFFTNPTYPFTELAYQLAQAGVSSVTGESHVRGEFLVDGYSLGTYDAALHRGLAADAWEAALAGQGISVASPFVDSDFDPPAGANSLVRWQAPPLEVTAVPINVQSHNEFADLLARHIGFELQGSSSYAAGATSMLEGLSALGVDTEGFSFFDGSGLSHDNRISAQGLTSLLQAMLRGQLAEAWVRTFSIAGVRGTLAGRMTGASTRGRFYGKSGTLYDTITTSGVLFHAYDGRRYAVSVLLNNDWVDIDKGAARYAEDQVVSVVAQDWRGVQAPPAPEFQEVRGVADGLAQLRWSPVDGAEAYVVYVSSDGWTWQRSEARLVDDASYLAGGLDPRAPTFFRVHAWNEANGEGPGSDVRVVNANDSSPRILLVDGNTRWAGEPNLENTRALANDFLVPTAESIPSAFAIDSISAADITSLDADTHAAAVWALGEESTIRETFDASEQARVSEYLAAGGALIASGAELGWDLWEQGSPEDRDWFTATFGATYVADDAGTYVVERTSDEGLPPVLGFFTPGHIDAAYPDVFTPGADATPLLEYVGGVGGTAALTYAGGHRSALLGFPLECIDNRSDRAALMAALFERLGL